MAPIIASLNQLFTDSQLKLKDDVNEFFTVNKKFVGAITST